jgi:hypothetical protein
MLANAVASMPLNNFDDLWDWFGIQVPPSQEQFSSRRRLLEKLPRN